MAIYEYKCKKCDTVFEKDFNLGKATQKAVCPFCGNKNCNRFFSPPMIQFIGSGFYVNDSKGHSETK